jgi:gamma-glutamylaminecyclotransferase
MLVFVYGTLKKGFGNHRLLTEATYLGKAVTLRPMRMAGYGVPFVWPSKAGRSVQGEVYDIGDTLNDQQARDCLRRLDRLESNGHVYDRKPHQVRMIEGPDGIKPLPRDQGEEHEAWIYEAMDHVQGSYKNDPDFDHDEARYMNDIGALEWSREPRIVHPAENIGSTTRDRRARPLSEVLRDDE